MYALNELLYITKIYFLKSHDSVMIEVYFSIGHSSDIYLWKVDRVFQF